MIVAVSRGTETVYVGKRVGDKEVLVCAKTGRVVLEVPHEPGQEVDKHAGTTSKKEWQLVCSPGIKG